MRKSSYTIKTTIKIDKELWKKSSHLVIEEKGYRKKTAVIEQLIKEYVEKKEKKEVGTLGAIILGAGMGTRLRPLTDKLPKALLKINSQTILEWQVESLRELGIRDITIVVGHEAEKIKTLCKNNHWVINFIFNNIYSTTNNLYSLWLAAKEKHNIGFICLNSDVVFDSKIIKRLLADDSDICLVVDEKVCIPEDMKVKIKGSKIVEINKTMQNGVYGEFMGILKFSTEGKKVLLNSTSKVKNFYLFNLAWIWKIAQSY